MKREWDIDEIKRLIKQQGGGGGAVDSVNGKTGTVVLTPSDLGLGNVDNTHDNVKNVASAATAGSAAKLTTAREIELTGEVTGSANFDGSADITINTFLGVPYVSSVNGNNGDITIVEPKSVAITGDIVGSANFDANGDVAITANIQAPYVQTVNGESGDLTIVEPKTVTLTGDATGTATFDADGNISIATTVSGGGSGGPAVTYVDAQSDMTDKTKIYSINGQENELYHTDGTTVFKIYPVTATPLYKHLFTIKRAGYSITLVLVDNNSTPITDVRIPQRVRTAVSIRMIAGTWLFNMDSNPSGPTRELGVITFMINESGVLELEGSNSPIEGEMPINRRQQFTKSTYSMVGTDTVTAL